jgi:hypothetical protein
MSTFYLLPPRPLLGQRFADYLQGLLPGLKWDQQIWPELAEVLAGAVARQADVFLVHREDLPAGADPARALVEGFGAEVGDEVIELHAGGRPGELSNRRWRIHLAA